MNDQNQRLLFQFFMVASALLFYQVAWSEEVFQSEGHTSGTAQNHIHISMADSDWVLGLGVSMGSMSSRTVGYGQSINFDYRFLSTSDSRFLSSIFLGVYGEHHSYDPSSNAMLFGLDISYHFSEENSGFIVSVAPTFGILTAKTTVNGLGLVPRIQYHVPLINRITAALELGAPMILVSPLNPYYNASVLVQFWF